MDEPSLPPWANAECVEAVARALRAFAVALPDEDGADRLVDDGDGGECPAWRLWRDDARAALLAAAPFVPAFNPRTHVAVPIPVAVGGPMQREG